MMNAVRNKNNGYRRILGIDYGRVRVGVSVSDPLQIIAQVVGTIHNTPQLFEEISVLVKQYNVETIVVGNPLTMKGNVADITREVHQFASTLRNVFDGNVILFDERLTSIQAQNVIRETASRKQQRNKATVDKVAAVFILQNYLDSKKFS
ncbi:MAG: Holliday junction resolvase RuvX [Ignavibacteria bacterium]|nr:Holliday junction resolvase RuvX [Ignavibacteria bacterium]